MSIEAADLLEIFQWTDPESAVEKKREDIEEELADVLIYCYTLAEKLDMDIDEIIAKKLVKNLKKSQTICIKHTPKRSFLMTVI